MLIRKLFKAEMAHCVPGAYTTRCHHLHGHSYKYELFLRADEPNAAEMVADFKEVKDIGINDFFDSFDHAVMLWEKDSRVRLAAQINPERHIIVPFVPTAEMMAKAFYQVAKKIFENSRLGETSAQVDHVVVHETDTGYASFGAADAENDAFPDIAFEKWIISDGIKADWKSKNWYNALLNPRPAPTKSRS